MSADSHVILIVEDEPTIADTLTYALETEGLTARWVSNGREALDIVAEEVRQASRIALGQSVGANQ